MSMAFRKGWEPPATVDQVHQTGCHHLGRTLEAGRRGMTETAEESGRLLGMENRDDK